MKLFTLLLAVIGAISLAYGFLSEGDDCRSVFVGLAGTMLLFVAFILWLFKVKKL